MHTYLLHACTGLGGGLGRLLAEPILKAMQESTEAGKNLSEARRVLEMVVPLAYRPPLKVCTRCCPAQGMVPMACMLPHPQPPAVLEACLWSRHLIVVNCQLHETSAHRNP